MNDRARQAHADVRMVGFAHRHTVDAVLAWLDAQLQPLGDERVPLRAGAGRVLAETVVSSVDVPGFDRATMDGYAVVAENTDGASSYNRIALAIVGESMPACPFEGTVASGQAVRIMTGAPMPRGADAVLPAEWADAAPDAAGARLVNALASTSPGKHVGRRGEDIVRGAGVLARGRVLRPQDLGVLSSIGRGDALVCRRPRVRLVITGNELLPSGSPPHGFRIADANGPMLAALVERDGGIVDFPGLVGDEEQAILDAMHAPADVVIVSGGSSVGIEDLAPTLLAIHGELAIHGIAMRPSSPTGLGRLGHRLVLLLPGNPVSSLCAYDFFAGRAIRVLGGRDAAWPYRSVRARLARKISSPIGRLDYARVTVIDEQPGPGLAEQPRESSSESSLKLVEPLSVGGASLLSSTTRADGFVIVGDDSEGYPAGADVDVWLYD
jgi:molybdopterin molybdotransferase